jgi:hypothetical protein
MLGEVYARLRDQDEKDKACVKGLLGRVAALTETRNSLLHAEWHMNYDYEGATNEFTAIAIKDGWNHKEGAYVIPRDVTESSLQGNIRDARAVQVLLRRLIVSLNQKGFKVSEQFARPL